MDVALRQVDVVVVGLTKHRYLRLQSIVLKRQFLTVLSSFLRHEVEHDLRYFTHLKNALALADAEIGRDRDLPLGGLLTDVTDDDGLLGLILDGDQAEVELVGEVKHGAAATSPDRHDKLFALRHNHKII